MSWNGANGSLSFKKMHQTQHLKNSDPWHTKTSIKTHQKLVRLENLEVKVPSWQCIVCLLCRCRSRRSNSVDHHKGYNPQLTWLTPIWSRACIIRLKMSLFNAGNFRYHWNQTVKARKSKKDAKSKRGGTFLPAIWKTYSPNGSSSPHQGGNSNMSTYLALIAKHPLWCWQARLSWSSVLKYLSLKGKSGMTKWSNYTSDVFAFRGNPYLRPKLTGLTG